MPPSPPAGAIARPSITIVCASISDLGSVSSNGGEPSAEASAFSTGGDGGDREEGVSAEGEVAEKSGRSDIDFGGADRRRCSGDSGLVLRKGGIDLVILPVVVGGGDGGAVVVAFWSSARSPFSGLVRSAVGDDVGGADGRGGAGPTAGSAPPMDLGAK
jgi:hypothetical protein